MPVSPLTELNAENTLAEMLETSPYQSYVYGYPHKTAYRAFPEPIPLEELWADEPQQALSLYVHLPFCEYRCGFCNLFTQSNPEKGLPRRYLQTLRQEAEQVRRALPEAKFARIAIGGGTPTYLETPELAELLSLLSDILNAPLAEVPFSVEASPATVTPEKLQLLKQAGVDRLSLGVQAFEDRWSHSLGRPQRRPEVEQALQQIRETNFPILNLDLIYGGEHQSLTDWQQTVQEALTWQPQELYLYPLYVRPLTGLSRRDRAWDDHRLSAYRAGRDLLLNAGYTQVSMRMFRSPNSPDLSGPVYCCQSDGMLGLGCGARSYTSEVHYSTEYAVGQTGIGAILSAYLDRKANWFQAAHYGDRLPMEDQRRRFVLLSLLQAEGLSFPSYRKLFGAELFSHLPECQLLEPAGLARIENDCLRLSERGLELSDAIGPWLSSHRVRQLMAEYEQR